ncbi:hypothetical protein JCM3774_001939 [Rhodotorula dairenensis]
MAQTLPSVEPLTPDEVAEIPSGSLPLGLQISHLVAEFARLTVQLFALVSTTSPSLAPAAAAVTAPTNSRSESEIATVLSALSQVDHKLAALLVMYEAHRRRQRRIESLVRQLSALEAQWRDSASSLELAVADLAPVIASGHLDREAISTAQGAHLEPAQLLAYARLLAPFTSAPPASLFPPEVKLKGVGATDPTGRTLPAGAIPPFPTEATMRGGRLQFGREGLLQGYLGETEQVGAEHDPHGAAAAAQVPTDAAARLENEAKLHAAAGTGRGGGPEQGGAGGDEAGGGADDFVFDLDLNPDL